MGKMLLILLMGGGMLFSIASLNINRSNDEMLGNTITEYQKSEAKDFAKSGIEFALRNLSNDTTWTGGTTQLKGGLVQISVKSTTSQYPNGPNADLTSARQITSIGICGNDSSTVLAVVQLPNANNPYNQNNPPAMMKDAITTGNNCSLNGNVDVEDDGNSAWNANVHANGDFNMNGNNMIKGFVTYGGQAAINPSWRENSNIKPNQNPNNNPNCSRSDQVDIPSFNANNFKSKAQLKYNSNTTISGNITLGTKTNPKIVYIGGDCTFKNTTISGYGEFIVAGNILVNGSVNVSTPDPNGSSLGLYTGGDININGNVTLWAQIYSGGNVNLNGNDKVHGSVTSKGTVNFNGHVQLYYRPADGNLTSPFWEGDEGEDDDSNNSNSNTNTRPSIVSYYE